MGVSLLKPYTSCFFFNSSHWKTKTKHRERGYIKNSLRAGEIYFLYVAVEIHTEKKMQ